MFQQQPRVVAAYCQVSRGRVLKWIEDGKLKAFKLLSGHDTVTFWAAGVKKERDLSDPRLETNYSWD